ncbi:MAG: fibronectin type III domain-containing protein, partial [Treponema sp.]|nr:fibronectin type III domain-containing protein [Treponema sp.]
IDLGQASSAILRLDALGGRIALAGDRVRNSYAGQEKFNFTDNSAVQFFMRAGDNPYQWTDADWQVVTPGTELPPVFRGRYAQFAAVLYPSADGETSPYLEEVRIVYRPNPPPQPPTRPTIVARDGMVELNWRHSPSAEAEGYLVYYGTAAEDYFGRGALRGPSPIDAGKRNTLRIEGLDNGTLYYFAIAAYSRTVDGEFRVGEFSREVTARPLLEYTAMRYE